MYLKLDEEVVRLLCCSLCKGNLVRHTECFVCQSCGLRFPRRAVKTDDNSEEFVFDFRILHPSYCVPKGLTSWGEAQTEYEQFHEKSLMHDSLQEYLDELDSVREVYTAEYHLGGTVLDVGGHQGRLRHYLESDTTLYVSADPCINMFSGIGRQPNLLRAYPCLSEACNFIPAHAEYLPFKSGSFDWIHMRSVVDHFADPYLAFLEAFRCSKIGGNLLVGLAVMERLATLDKKRASLPTRVARKMKNDGFIGLLRTISGNFGRFTALGAATQRMDDHLFRLTYDTLMDLFAKTGWYPIKEHWQKPPFQFCIYACGQKREHMRAAQ